MTGSKSNSESSSTGTTVNKYSNTTTANPFVKSTTNNNGTKTTLNNGALKDTYNFINNNASGLLDQYLNPSLDSVTNQAKIVAYNNELNKQTTQALNNDIINPLYQRGLIRSSAANDMYNKLSENNAKNYSDFLTSLLANNDESTANQINTLSNLYNQIYSAVLSNQAQSLQTSSGNATTTKTSNTKGTVG